MPWAKLE